MQELQHLAAWVKERYAQEYILTWLLSQPGLWWSDGEVYQAAMQKSGKLLKDYVQKKQEGEVFQGIADKLVKDETWDAVAVSLGRIFGVYQQELVKLQDPSRREGGKAASADLTVKAAPVLEVQQALPDPYSDPLTRR
ncbi:hypothetical protein BCD67_12650 [Oscillatoriales cyanobacterium USR001]|nr:hypothetical protein BCD67_12650 [Oscillatoriales cyanobacterium USR001]